MIVYVANPGRPIDVDTFADITPIPVVSPPQWVNGKVRIEFESDLDDATRKLVWIRASTGTDDTDESTLRAAASAQNVNLAYLAIASPTLEQIAAQVATLTRQAQGFIQLNTPADDTQ